MGDDTEYIWDKGKNGYIFVFHLGLSSFYTAANVYSSITEKITVEMKCLFVNFGHRQTSTNSTDKKFSVYWET